MHKNNKSGVLLAYKRKIIQVFCITGLLISCLFASATDGVPSISNVRFVNKPGTARLIILYDLAGTGNDSIRITVHVSDRRNVDVKAFSLNGDVGYPVSPGLNKSVTLKYRNVASDIVQIKLIASDGRKTVIQELLHEIEPDSIKKYLTAIYGLRNRKKGLNHLEQVKKIIASEFRRCSLQVKKQEFVYAGYKGHNIIGHLKGIGDENTRYLVTAHFDAVANSPGADDNASGTAGLLEVMRILSKHHFRHSIDFIAFDQEEEGSIGSQHYISKYDSLAFNIAGVFNLDMIGAYSNRAKSQLIPENFSSLFPNVYNTLVQDSVRGNFVLDISNDSSQSIAGAFEKYGNSYVPGFKVITLVASDSHINAMPELADSDHGGFWQHGRKAVHIGVGGPSRDANYHSPTDTIEKIDYLFLGNVVKALAATLAELAEVTETSSYSAFVKLRAPANN